MEGLHIHGATHTYGDKTVLKNVSLVVPDGELVCLLGPSGCGKSTLLRLAAGLEVLQEGSIVINDVTVATPELHVPPERRRIGLMFQDYALFPHLNVIDNVTFGLLRTPKHKAHRRAMELLDQVGMSDFARAFPHMLSGGMQQRVALARALAPEPRLLLLDEPFSGLDTNMGAKIRQDTLNVLRDSGVATLMVTHNPEEAMYMADRIKVLGRHGDVLQTGTAHEIYYHPHDEYVTRLFGLMNTVDSVVQNSLVETPFGAVPAGELEDGLPVQVLIRPEGILLARGTGDDDATVDVKSAHLLGHDTIVRIRLGTDTPEGQEYFVRVNKEFVPELEKEIVATIDPELCFVFPKDESRARGRMSDDLDVVASELEALLSTDANMDGQADIRAEAAE